LPFPAGELVGKVSGRFAGWLGGILVNVCRAQRRRPPLTLLGDWPENLHPASAGRSSRTRRGRIPSGRS
jgi:hypothetical protein